MLNDSRMKCEKFVTQMKMNNFSSLRFVMENLTLVGCEEFLRGAGRNGAQFVLQIVVGNQLSL